MHYSYWELLELWYFVPQPKDTNTSDSCTLTCRHLDIMVVDLIARGKIRCTLTASLCCLFRVIQVPGWQRITKYMFPDVGLVTSKEPGRCLPQIVPYIDAPNPSFCTHTFYSLKMEKLGVYVFVSPLLFQEHELRSTKQGPQFPPPCVYVTLLVNCSPSLNPLVLEDKHSKVRGRKRNGKGGCGTLRRLGAG